MEVPGKLGECQQRLADATITIYFLEQYKHEQEAKINEMRVRLDELKALVLNKDAEIKDYQDCITELDEMVVKLEEGENE